MSVIMRFSARSFSEPRSCRARRTSCSGVRPLGAVPFMGLDVMRSPSRVKKSSGEALHTAHLPRSRYAPQGGSWDAARAWKNSQAQPVKVDPRRSV
jgi:hypothetical protein